MTTVRRRANCQLDRIQSLLGDGVLAMLVGSYLDYINQARKLAHCGRHHSLSRILDCVMEKGS